MKRESVIITNFLIERPKQIKLFQLKIPREAENIIGVEIGLTWISGTLPTFFPAAIWELPMMIKRNTILGELKLQSYEKANMFYTQELMLCNNLDIGDYTSLFFTPKPFTHASASNEEEVKVSGNTTILQGVYRDALADQIQGPYKYLVRVYVWHDTRVELLNIKP